MSPAYLENDARAELLKIEGLDALILWLKRLDCPPWDRVRLKHLDACALTPRRASGTIRWGRYAKGGEFRVSFCYKIQICSFCLLGERFFFAGLQDGSIFIMYRSTLKVLGTLNGHTRAVLAMVSVGEILISGSEDGDIRAWDISSDSRLGPDRCMRVFQAHHGGVTCLAVAGNRLMSGGHDWSACVWRMTGQGAEWSCRLDFELDQHQSSVVSLVTFEDKLVTGSRDHSILVWNLIRQKVEQELVGHTGEVLAMVVTVSGRRLISSSADQTSRVWSLATGACEQTVPAYPAGSSKRIEKLAICGSMLLGGSDGLSIRLRRSQVRVWDLKKMELLHTKKQPFFGGGVVALVADRGEVLAALDSQVAVWGR
jgi:WD40 repeat protein